MQGVEIHRILFAWCGYFLNTLLGASLIGLGLVALAAPPPRAAAVPPAVPPAARPLPPTGGANPPPSGGFAPPEQVLFAPLVMLAPPGPNRAARAVALFDRATRLHRKIAFHPAFAPELQDVVARMPPRQSTLIRAAALYSRDDIPWSRRPPATRYIAVAGHPRADDYFYSLAPNFLSPEQPGDFAGIFALRPATPLHDEANPRSVVGEIGGEIDLDTFGAAEWIDVAAAALSEIYGDLAPPWDSAPGAWNQHDRAAMERLARDLPAVAERLDHYLSFSNIVDEFARDGSPLVLFNLDATVREERLKPFPHLYRFYRRIAPRVVVNTTVDDGHGHLWLQFGFDRGRVKIAFLNRDGMLVPMDERMALAGTPVALDRLESGHYHSVASARIHRFGMDFGLDNLSFLTDYHRSGDRVVLASQMTAVPEVIAPPIVHHVILLIAGEFMRVLATGNNGHGVSARFSSDRASRGNISVAGGVSAELRYSPTLEFLARIGDAVAEAHNEDVRNDERRLGEELFNALMADYERDRARILSLGTTPAAK